MTTTSDRRIIAFVCNWCAYGATQTAAMDEREMPPNVALVRVMCASRVSQNMILDAFRAGARGVIVYGCHPENCHFVTGSRTEEERVLHTKNLLGLLGISPERLHFVRQRASELNNFVDRLAEFAQQINEGLGPAA
jgi:coenzyme F420-reducing hydrogenase delta subunit